ncbi:hypothetical protein Sru01_17670 [Sphaerisporangium rufum]|uniref:Uncharacterized protein n=1 Tax=Sphaerisporangium rufum TaxID=1381558 RepID=A0A919V404_9ACTN|nr:hypothetical protein Sru01_17670 [Sphaerisporangium rufum]
MQQMNRTSIRRRRPGSGTSLLGGYWTYSVRLARYPNPEASPDQGRPAPGRPPDMEKPRSRSGEPLGRSGTAAWPPVGPAATGCGRGGARRAGAYRTAG